MTAHDSRIHFKLNEIEVILKSLAEAIAAVSGTLDACNDALVDARLKNLAVSHRRAEIAADVAIIREMLGTPKRERVQPPTDKYLDFVERPKRRDL